MKKLIRIGLILFGIGLLSALGVYLYVFHKPHRNIAQEKPAYVISADSLYSEFSIDEVASYEKYGNQVLQVSGTVIDLTHRDNGSMIYLESLMGINCYFDSLSVVTNRVMMDKIKVGGEVSLKGQCDGYDMLMGVVLTRCVLVGTENDMAMLED